jgi:hypothetical protein
MLDCGLKADRLPIPKMESSPPPFHVSVEKGQGAAGGVFLALTFLENELICR